MRFTLSLKALRAVRGQPVIPPQPDRPPEISATSVMIP
jgi:hypothetical protein